MLVQQLIFKSELTLDQCFLICSNNNNKPGYSKRIKKTFYIQFHEINNALGYYQ